MIKCYVLVQIDIVNEDRLYPKWKEADFGEVDASSGIISGKRLLNELHQFMAQQGSNYDQVTSFILMIKRNISYYAVLIE